MQEQFIMAMIGVVGGLTFVYLWVTAFTAFLLSKIALDKKSEIHRSLQCNGLREKWMMIVAMVLVAMAWPYLYVKAGRSR